jgi:hypothetical protein
MKGFRNVRYISERFHRGRAHHDGKGIEALPRLPHPLLGPTVALGRVFSTTIPGVGPCDAA